MLKKTTKSQGEAKEGVVELPTEVAKSFVPRLPAEDIQKINTKDKEDIFFIEGVFNVPSTPPTVLLEMNESQSGSRRRLEYWRHLSIC